MNKKTQISVLIRFNEEFFRTAMTFHDCKLVKVLETENHVFYEYDDIDNIHQNLLYYLKELYEIYIIDLQWS